MFSKDNKVNRPWPHIWGRQTYKWVIVKPALCALMADAEDVLMEVVQGGDFLVKRILDLNLFSFFFSFLFFFFWSFVFLWLYQKSQFLRPFLPVN